MKTIIRTHVKNDERLALLARTIQSAYRAVGPDILVVDDQSPMGKDVRLICNNFKVEYRRTEYQPCTKNGLYWSFKYGGEGNLFCITDDCVLGQGITKIMEQDLDPQCWLLTFFAGYPMQIRISRAVGNIFWNYPVEAFYAGIACVYHTTLSRLYMEKWEHVMRGEEPKEDYQDDLTIKHLIMANGKQIWGTMYDFAQHTGVQQRSFGDIVADAGSNYVSECFVGE